MLLIADNFIRAISSLTRDMKFKLKFREVRNWLPISLQDMLAFECNPIPQYHVNIMY